jgi:hypothetical protein
MYPIVDEEIDLAGKYRVRVIIRDVTVMFKYDFSPTVERVEQDAAKYEADVYPPEPDPAPEEMSDGAPNPE